MSKEIRDIITAFNMAEREGRRTALATVVHVEGSSYRQPGARMLVEDNGKITGAISGGCLEGDALKKALLVINQQQNKLVTYNTLHDDDIEFGVQLGCNGIVHILFEPVNPERKDHPVALLALSLKQRKNAVMVTMFSLKDYYGHQPGTVFFFNGEENSLQIEDDTLSVIVQEDVAYAFTNRTSFVKQYNNDALTAFIELLEPPVSLVIVGAGNDAIPLLDFAEILGWPVTIVDGRPAHASRQRFGKASNIIVAKPEDAIKKLAPDIRTAVVLMTHNFNYDVAMLEQLIKHEWLYIGTLGPKTRLQRMLTTLAEQGIVLTDAQQTFLYGPTGLDIGAETPEEIALSITAEIKAVLTKRSGTPLRERTDKIHRDLLIVTGNQSTQP